MNASSSPTRNVTAKSLYRSLLAAGYRTITVAQAAEVGATIGMRLDSVYRALGRLADNDDGLIRMSRGRYAVTDLATGAIVAHPFVLATTAVSPSAVSHWSALQHWGFTTQLSNVVFVSSPRRGPQLNDRQEATSPESPKASRGYPTQRIVTIPQHRFFGITDEWFSEHDRVSIFERERAVLDLFHHFHIFGPLATALEILDEHALDLDLDRLVQHALRFNVGAVIKRLGWSLETVGVDRSALTPLLAFPVKEESPLDPRLPARGHRNTTWRVIENLRSE